MLLTEKTQRNKESKQDVMREKTAYACVQGVIHERTDRQAELQDQYVSNN